MLAAHTAKSIQKNKTQYQCISIGFKTASKWLDLMMTDSSGMWLPSLLNKKIGCLKSKPKNWDRQIFKLG
jgi:hypothetical protein